MKKTSHYIVILVLILLLPNLIVGCADVYESTYTSTLTNGYLDSSGTEKKSDQYPLLKTGKIVYGSLISDEVISSQIYLMDLSTRIKLPLTNDGSSGSPEWSPDGTKILYISDALGNKDDIYIMDADGGNKVPLIQTAGTDSVADWSPDGNAFLYTSNISGKTQIYSYSFIDDSITRLSDFSEDFYSPTFSSDGSRIAFSSTMGSGNTGRTEIFTMDYSGKPITQITEYQVDQYDTSPVWCSNDQCIYFIRVIGNTSTIMEYDFSTKSESRLLNKESSGRLFDAYITGISLSADKNFLLILSLDGSYAYEIQTGNIYSLDVDSTSISYFP